MNRESNSSISVFLIEDNELFRFGMTNALRNDDVFEVVGEASSYDIAAPALFRIKPQIILMDISIPGTDGIEATRILCSKEISSRIIILSIHEHGEKIIEAFQAGAASYVLKSQEPEMLIDCIKTVAAGKGFLESSIAQLMIRSIGDRCSMESEIFTLRRKQLTNRELQVLDLASQGFTNNRIATALFISSKTVKNHLSHIYQKLCCADRAQAVLKAVKSGLLDGDSPTTKNRDDTHSQK